MKEYKVLYVKQSIWTGANPKAPEQDLNKFAAEGWELRAATSIHHSGAASDLVFVLERDLG